LSSEQENQDLNTQSVFWNNLKKGLLCRCPRCGEGSIYKGLILLKDRCSQCNLNIANNDNGDGPAVLLIFLFGFLLVPLALIVDYYLEPALWVHFILWSIIGVGFTILALRPAKAYVMVLIYHHRPDMWNDKEELDDPNKSE
tara:strand:+ start:306 stop:731 length:426 start_codon:yes stop_codon:yes gene_type:complete